RRQRRRERGEGARIRGHHAARLSAAARSRHPRFARLGRARASRHLPDRTRWRGALQLFRRARLDEGRRARGAREADGLMRRLLVLLSGLLFVPLLAAFSAAAGAEEGAQTPPFIT